MAGGVQSETTRQGRFSEKPAQWILQHLETRADIEARLLDGTRTRVLSGE